MVDVPLRGYGAALRAGIESAQGTYVIMGDADDSDALDQLGPFLEALPWVNQRVTGMAAGLPK